MQYRQGRMFEGTDIDHKGCSNSKKYKISVNNRCNFNVNTLQIFKPKLLLFRFTEQPLIFNQYNLNVYTSVKLDINKGWDFTSHSWLSSTVYYIDCSQSIESIIKWMKLNHNLLKEICGKPQIDINISLCIPLPTLSENNNKIYFLTLNVNKKFDPIFLWRHFIC